MSNNNGGRNNRTRGSKSGNSIPFIRADGTKATIGLDQVRGAGDVKRYHGTNPLDGTQVHSMASKALDRSIAISVNDRFGKGQTISVPKPEAIVFAMGLLTDNGFTVTAPTAKV